MEKKSRPTGIQIPLFMQRTVNACSKEQRLFATEGCTEGTENDGNKQKLFRGFRAKVRDYVDCGLAGKQQEFDR